VLKQSITYKNVDGKTVTEDFYFNLTKAELMKLEMQTDGGFKSRIEQISTPGAAGGLIIEVFEMLLAKAYGVRTPDGSFVKNPAAFDEFLASEAYSTLLFDVLTTPTRAAAFFNGIMPTDLAQEVEMEMKKSTENIFDTPEPSIPHNVVRAEAGLVENPNSMTDDELLKSLGAGDDESLTGGFTDDEIKAMSPVMLRGKPREVLLRAYQLKNQK